MSDAAAARPADTASTAVTSVSMSTCSALVRLTSFFGSAFCASSAEDPRPMVSATQRATMPLIFFMPLSRSEQGHNEQLMSAVVELGETESADHRDSIRA